MVNRSPENQVNGAARTRPDVPRPLLMAATLLLVVVVGVADYLTGYEISFSIFYLAAVALATWRVGPRFGLFVSGLSILSAVWSDLAAGAHYSNPFVPAWNAAIDLIFYALVVWLLTRLRSFQRELEDRVRQRTGALANEMAERARLEKELLEIGERERRAIGHDLHDSLGQHLTGTAFASQVLADRLADKDLPEAGDARRIVSLIEQGIEITRRLSRGLHPMELQAEGLMASLRELAKTTSEQAPVRCQLDCDPPVLVEDATLATHLYRIAQEAISNACKHGRPTSIFIRLSSDQTGIQLSVLDDGTGVPEPLPKGPGMGLRIMAHRASIIGGSLKVSRGASGGTVVTCTVP